MKKTAPSSSWKNEIHASVQEGKCTQRSRRKFCKWCDTPAFFVHPGGNSACELHEGKLRAEMQVTSDLYAKEFNLRTEYVGVAPPGDVARQAEKIVRGMADRRDYREDRET